MILLKTTDTPVNLTTSYKQIGVSALNDGSKEIPLVFTLDQNDSTEIWVKIETQVAKETTWEQLIVERKNLDGTSDNVNQEKKLLIEGSDPAKIGRVKFSIQDQAKNFRVMAKATTPSGTPAQITKLVSNQSLKAGMVGGEVQESIKISDGVNNVDVVNKDGQNSLKVTGGVSEDFSIMFRASSIGANTGFMLVDLSNASGKWPHTNAGHINIKTLQVGINPKAGFLGQIRIGFLTNVDGTNGDLNVLDCWDFTKESERVDVFKNFDLSALMCETSTHFGPIDANISAFNTGTNLKGPDELTSYPSGNGDLVAYITRTAQTVDICIGITYETIT